MISYCIVQYCDFMISYHEYIKSWFKPNMKSILLSNAMPRERKLELLKADNRRVYTISCTRDERHTLYKLLKGKASPYTVFSTGDENRKTQKSLYIVKKKLT